MVFRDLREFIRAVDKLGELQNVDGANWDLEIGAITELVAERKGPALLFDRIVDYPPGFRILTNAFTSQKRTALVLGLPPELNSFEMLKVWREKLKWLTPITPVEVKDGPVMQNVYRGPEIDIFRFPAPKWHELDGGRYLGTGCNVITKDPEEGWVNVATYRCMLYDKEKNIIATKPNKGRHAGIMIEKYHARGLPCPVVITFGQDPVLFIASTSNMPWGVSEYDFAGGLRGTPIEVVKGEFTGLPIPASAEIAIEGEIPPPEMVESREEGPFGEWLGYFAVKMLYHKDIINIKTVYHRDDPIILGAKFLKPPAVPFSIPLTAANIWNQLEKAGIMGIKGVWVPIFESAFMVILSIKQMYAGHAKQAALQAASCMASTGGARFVIVVDDDVDITDLEEVFWAVSTRWDTDNIEILKRMQVAYSFPLITQEQRDRADITTSRVVIDACRPFSQMKDFPPVNGLSPEYREKVVTKWGDLLAKL